MGDDDQQLPEQETTYLSESRFRRHVAVPGRSSLTSFSNIGFNTIGLLESGRVDLAGMWLSGLREALSVSRIPRIPTGSCPPFDLGTASTSTRSSIGMSSIGSEPASG